MSVKRALLNRLAWSFLCYLLLFAVLPGIFVSSTEARTSVSESSASATLATAQSVGHLSSITIYARVIGMRSIACEKFAERKLSNALDSLLDVRADHQTGWIEIELEDRGAQSGGELPEESENVEAKVDPAIAEAIRGALEADCGFELESLETTQPNADDAGEAEG